MKKAVVIVKKFLDSNKEARVDRLWLPRQLFISLWEQSLFLCCC